MTAFPALFAAFPRTKKKAGERHWRFSRQCLFTAARSAGCYGGLRVLKIDTFFETPGTNCLTLNLRKVAAKPRVTTVCGGALI